MLFVTFSARFFSIFSNWPRERDQHYVMSGAFNLSKQLPFWNLYFHSPTVNTTFIVIQGLGQCYDLLSVVSRTNEVSK